MFSYSLRIIVDHALCHTSSHFSQAIELREKEEKKRAKELSGAVRALLMDLLKQKLQQANLNADITQTKQ